MLGVGASQRTWAPSPVPAGWRAVDVYQGTIAPVGPNRLQHELDTQDVRVIGVRHCQSEANAQEEREGVRQLCGRTDSPLSPQGRAEAQATARAVYAKLGGDEWLRQGGRAPILYCGPLSRARDTAQATADYIAHRAQDLGRHMPLAPQVDERLTEINFGDYEMTRPSPEALVTWDHADGVDFLHRFPGGESRADVLGRVQSFLHDVARHDAGRTVVLFTHTETICALRDALGRETGDDGRMHQGTWNLARGTPWGLT